MIAVAVEERVQVEERADVRAERQLEEHVGDRPARSDPAREREQRTERQVARRPGGADHDPMRARLEVRLAGVDERVREDQHQAQPAARRPPAVMGQRQAVRELVDRHQRKPPGDEHRAADQRGGWRRRTACRTARRRCRRNAPNPASANSDQERHASAARRTRGPSGGRRARNSRRPTSTRLVARLEDPRQRALWLRRRRRRGADTIEQPAVGEIGDQAREPPRPGRPNERSASVSSSATVRLPSSSSNSAASSASIRTNAPPSQVSQDKPLLALVGGEPLERPAGPHARAAARPSKLSAGVGAGAQAHQRRVDRHDDRLAGTCVMLADRRGARHVHPSGAGASAATPMNTSPTRISAPGNSRVGPSTALPETDVPKLEPASSITGPSGTETDTRVHARDGLVDDPDACLLAAADRQRPADRHTRAVGQQQHEPLGFGGRGCCRHVSHRATTAARPGCRRSWRSPSESRRDCGC